MDNLDEFEMRPLTNGLGFQKKVAEMKRSLQKSQIAKEKLGTNLPVTPPPHEMEETAKTRNSEDIISEIRRALKPIDVPVKLSTTLPRPGEKLRTTSVEPEISRIPDRSDRDPLGNINFQVPNRELVEDRTSTGTRRGASDSLIRPLVPISFNIASAAIDGVIVIALSMIFLAALVSVTGIDVNSVLLSARSDFAAQIALGVLMLAVLELYMVLARSFFGRTLGEWTFEVQLGEDEQIARATYPVRVLHRSFINLVTGLILLPVLSLVFRRDLAGELSGVRLFRQNT